MRLFGNRLQWFRPGVWGLLASVCSAALLPAAEEAPDRPDSKPEAESGSASSEAPLWSLKRPTRPPVPGVRQTDWPLNTIDRFILSRLEAEGLQPVAEADRRSWIRRVYFDLIGLPPSPEEVAAFVNDDSPRAYEKVVDRLLASPHFGEKWARHWLDVARYAESSGREFNFTYPHAWPYRDYVIEAFNEDKPYDAFIREQVAGDLIAAKEDATGRRRDELRIATGFLAVGPKRHNAGNRDFHADLVDDQINTTSRAVLALTVSCARCHDHKFDPIPTEDYYALAGIFRSTKTLDGTIDQKYSRHPTEPIPIGPDAQKKHEAAEEHERQVEKLSKQLDEAKKERKKARAALEKRQEKQKMQNGADGKNSESEGSENDGEAGTPDERLEELKSNVAELNEKVEKLEGRLEQLKADPPPRPDYAMGVRDRKAPDAVKVAIGGDPRKRGDPVPRGFLSAVKIDGVPDIPAETSGRLQLARWLTSRNNPLTARVMVNRLWQHLFGRGLVSTVDNFGKLGRKPTHPALLDHLAVTFMDEDDWSVKRMIRRMVLSRTYRLSTAYDPENFRADPRNTLRWRMSPRRLEAEQIRDALLAVSGRLDRSPPHGSPVTELGSQLARRISRDKLNPPSRHRSIYLPIVRDYLPELLQTFDYASASLVMGERSVTTVPAQALYLLNSDFALEQSEHFARRVLKAEDLTDEERLDLAWTIALSRPPSSKERRKALEFLRQAEQSSDEPPDRLTIWTSLCQSLIAGAEFRYLVDAPGDLPHERRVARNDDG